MNKAVSVTATFFGCGNFPFASGTFCSLIVAVIYLLTGLSGPGALLFTAVCAVVGFFTAGKYEKETGIKDDGRIVIDEACGMSLALLGQPVNLFSVFILFALFRFFDIIKPEPAYSIQNLKGGPGVMLDDIAAGFYASLLFSAWRYFLNGAYGL